MKKMLFVFNPRSGKEQIKGQLMEILDIFTKAGYELRVHVTQKQKDAMEVVAKNPNVYVDLSGLLEGNFDGSIFFEKHRDYFRYLRMWLDYVGQYDRVLYGTDWPLINIHSYIDTMKLVVPEEHHEEFFYRNALRVYTKLLGLLPKEEEP